MPAAFTPAQLGQLARAADARLALAAAAAPDGQVIQFLAGAPELLARYRNAPPAAAALIDAAMDARRLGMGAGLPQAFLEAAAPGYLTDAEWDALGEDWLEQALAYTAVPCKGVRGPLTRIRPRPARPARPARLPDGDDQPPPGRPTAGGPLYRLADYLDQHGRAHRDEPDPPGGVLGRGRRPRLARRPGRARGCRRRSRPVPGRRPAAQERRRIRQPPRRSPTSAGPPPCLPR